MASLLVLLLLSSSPSSTSASHRPTKSLALPLTKDPSTLQYTLTILQRTPSVPLLLSLDLGGRYLWTDCDTAFSSSTYRPVSCRSTYCASTRSSGCADCLSPPSRPGCNNNTCSVLPDNPFTRVAVPSELSLDVLSLPHSTTVLPRFLFSCAPASLLAGLAPGAKGVAGLGRTHISLPSQLSAAFSFPRKFSLCLSRTAHGIALLGDEPVPDYLTYTPLLTNPVSTATAFVSGEPSYEYFIGVKGININGKPVRVNATLLSIDQYGFGGTKISTADPYAVMETGIFQALADAFERESRLKRVPAVTPFSRCFHAGTTAAVPEIRLVLQSERVVWRMLGANSVVDVGNGLVCLAFLDGGESPKTPIVIGGYQIEDNLLQFDLARSRLGFSSSLLFHRTTCADLKLAVSSPDNMLPDRKMLLEGCRDMFE